jgi:hypothetical protein
VNVCPKVLPLIVLRLSLTRLPDPVTGLEQFMHRAAVHHFSVSPLF